MYMTIKVMRSFVNGIFKFFPPGNSKEEAFQMNNCFSEGVIVDYRKAYIGVISVEKYLVSEAQQFDEERFTKVNIIKNKRSTAFLLNFLPGQHMKPHNHPEQELYLYVIEGSGVFTFDGKELEVEKGDVLYCSEKEQIGFTNTSEGKTSIYCTMTKMTE